MSENHKTKLYNILLILSRDIFFYKKKGEKFNQYSYDTLFNNIENNLRELGFGDVTVNKKMKDFNKILYDILLKIDSINSNDDQFKINNKIIYKYFVQKDHKNELNYKDMERYFNDFFNFCFELSLNNMIKEAKNYKIRYGST